MGSDGHGLGARTVHVPVGATRPVGPTLQINSRPDVRRPVHVHDAAPRGEQFAVSIVNPCVLAIARAYSAACSSGVFVPKHPASTNATANPPAPQGATSGITLRCPRPIISRGPIP
jgi:hypothetical protein